MVTHKAITPAAKLHRGGGCSAAMAATKKTIQGIPKRELKKPLPLTKKGAKQKSAKQIALVALIAITEEDGRPLCLHTPARPASPVMASKIKRPPRYAGELNGDNPHSFSAEVTV